MLSRPACTCLMCALVLALASLTPFAAINSAAVPCHRAGTELGMSLTLPLSGQTVTIGTSIMASLAAATTVKAIHSIVYGQSLGRSCVIDAAIVWLCGGQLEGWRVRGEDSCRTGR